MLGICRRTLSRMIQRWGLPRRAVTVGHSVPTRARRRRDCAAEAPEGRCAAQRRLHRWHVDCLPSSRPRRPLRATTILPRRTPMFRTLAFASALWPPALDAHARRAEQRLEPSKPATPSAHVKVDSTKQDDHCLGDRAEAREARRMDHGSSKEAQQGLAKAGLYRAPRQGHEQGHREGAARVPVGEQVAGHRQLAIASSTRSSPPDHDHAVPPHPAPPSRGGRTGGRTSWCRKKCCRPASTRR